MRINLTRSLHAVIILHLNSGQCQITECIKKKKQMSHTRLHCLGDSGHKTKPDYSDDVDIKSWIIQWVKDAA
jgi:hypothetical protein